MGNLILLSPKNASKNKPTKILDKELNKISSFDAGYEFYFYTLEYENIHEAMKDVFEAKNSFIILGALTDYGQKCENEEITAPRRKKKGIPTIEDRLGNQIVLDLDDHVLPKFNPLDPKLSIKHWLKSKKITCDVTWQITSGQKLNTKEARIRLYFECTKDLTLGARKAWSQGEDIMADGSVYTCSQPIYTAPPIIKGTDKDPIPNRTGFIKGNLRQLRIKEVEPKEITETLKRQSTVDWNFNDSTLPEDVLSGKVYRRYFMPLAFHYVNKLKGDREAVFAIIAAKSSMVKKREFNADNAYAFIDDAIEKVESEDNTEEIATAEDILEPEEKVTALDAPVFPENLMESWPDPWPMLWENFKVVPRQLEESLLVPTVLALNAFLLRSNFVTSYSRRPNMFFLNLTPSTGNKDVNSKNVIRDLNTIFKNEGHLVNNFSGILNTESNITADSTFLQAFDENEELFWINTEATRIFQQIRMAGAVSAVAALSDKLIEVVDGHEITGKVKAAGKVKTIQNPNAQVLFYAQPETIERYIDETMVDSGLFGRALLTITPELKFEIDGYEMFKEHGGVNAVLDSEFIDFYNSPKFNLTGVKDRKTVLKPNIKSRALLNDWARE